MSEATQVAQPTAQQPISVAQGAALLAEKRAQSNAPNPASEAARMLGQRSAEARKERQAQAQPATENPSGEGEQNAQDTSEEIQDETVTTEQSTETEADTKSEDAGTPQEIDLGDGVKVSIDEVRDGFLRQADYTRKTQALADERKAVEAARTQKLAQLDKLLDALHQQVGPEPDWEAVIAEDPAEGTRKYFAWQKQQKKLAAAAEIARREKIEAMAESYQARDRWLAEHYKPEWADDSKRDEAYTQLTEYAQKLGASENELRSLAKPWMIQVIHKAMERDAIEAGKAKVTKVTAGKPAVVKPGTKVSAQSSAHTAVQKAQAQLKSSGNIADAIALLRAKRARGG
jgi:hypothetical protein